MATFVTVTFHVSEGPPISSPAPAAEGHKTAGNGSLSAALDASTGGMPRADGQLSRPARSTRKAEVRSRQVQKLPVRFLRSRQGGPTPVNTRREEVGRR